MRAFFVGLQFLTRISLVNQEEWQLEDFGRSVKFFPLIGTVLGMVYALAAYCLRELLPQHQLLLPHHFTMVFLLLMPPLLTGGLHCDGFMDTMDGIFSGRSRERMLEIMKDSRVGSNGVFCFVALMLFEWAILLDMPSKVMVTAFFVMPVISRLMMVGAITLFAYARPEGMGKAFVQYADKGTLTFALVTAMIMVIPCGCLAVVSLLVSILFSFYFARYVTKLLGGLTGDIYGAIVTLNEALVLLVFLVGASYAG